MTRETIRFRAITTDECPNCGMGPYPEEGHGQHLDCKAKFCFFSPRVKLLSFAGYTEGSHDCKGANTR